MAEQNLIPIERIQSIILLFRNQKVIVDADLADLYGVSTKRLNEAVKRNITKFPGDFMFRLTNEEKRDLVANCDRFKNLKHSTVFPSAFTEHGALMAATVLNSSRANEMSLVIIRTFVKLRQMIAEHKDFAQRLDDLEKKYDYRFKIVFDALRDLIEPPENPKKHPIGFNTK
ncbi:MAG: hypothetical protein K0S38_933 [Candidatus Paceibacter sp.]|jgi:hypothetical protein|nr:hypothetical protein [Candidatus Paceibacter sp.]